MPKAREESWAYLVPLPLLSVTKAVWHTPMGDHAGEKVALLAQLRLPLATSATYIPPDKSILLPAPHASHASHAPHAPHALPCAPGGGTDVPCSQYSTLSLTLFGANAHRALLAYLYSQRDSLLKQRC